MWLAGMADISTNALVSATELVVRYGTTTVLDRAGLPAAFPNQPGLSDRIHAAMRMDKKFREGKNLFVLPTGIGAWRQVENIAQPVIDDAVTAALGSGA